MESFSSEHYLWQNPLCIRSELLDNVVNALNSLIQLYLEKWTYNIESWQIKVRGKTTVYEFPHPHWCWDCDIIIVMDGGVVQQPVGTMETEGETHNSVPNYEIITITFLQIRTIRSVFTACGDKWYQWISSFLSLNTYNPVITKTDFTSIIFYY